MAASKDVVVDEESGRTVRVARPNMHDLNLPEGGSILDKPATKWDKEEVVDMKAQYEDIQGTNDDAYTKYNPDPGEVECKPTREAGTTDARTNDRPERNKEMEAKELTNPFDACRTMDDCRNGKDRLPPHPTQQLSLL